MFTSLALLNLLIAPAAASRLAVSLYRPHVEVWTDHDDAYQSGDGVRIHFRTDQDAYVTVLRVDTDGRVRVLFPRQPWEDNFAAGGREYDVQGYRSRYGFYVDDYPGVGYLFAVAAADPFVYDALESGDHWDYRVIADGRVRGDPYVALTDLAQRIVPAGYNDWDYDIAPYYVQQHYDYPRFLCYDCHSYVSYPYWDPYAASCIRFRIVVFDDPYYYPYRYYGGTRVAFTRPFRPEPRFIFKDRQGSDLFVTRVRERPVNDDQRREVGVGVRGRDLGGTGVIPPPDVTRRERPARPEEPGADERGRRGDRPDQPGRPGRLGRPGRPDHPERPDVTPRPDLTRPDWQVPLERPRGEGRDVERPRSERPTPAQPERPRVEPRAVPRGEAPAEPQARARAEPRVERPAPPRSEPRVEPKREGVRPQRSEPELRRRKP